MTKSDGFTLHTQQWLIDDAKASLIIVHGLGEHCARYEGLASVLNEIGINVYSFDLRGHGLSQGPRAFVNDMSEYLSDLQHVYSQTPKDRPLFIFGHSMGGLIVVDFLLQKKRKEIRGAIITGAALETGEDITPLKKRLISLLNWISPNLKTVKLDPSLMSRDPVSVEKYVNDPLVFHDAGKAGMAAALLKRMDAVNTQLTNVDYPILIMHGGADQITNPLGSTKLYKQSTSKDKTLKIWDGAFHEVFHETNKADVMAYMTSWLLHRL